MGYFIAGAVIMVVGVLVGAFCSAVATNISQQRDTTDPS